MTETADNLADDPTDDEEGEPSVLVLLFTAEGGVVLEEDGEPVWMSDDDDDFLTEFDNAFLDPDEDGRKILNWLEEEGWLEDEDEKAKVEIVSENEDGEVIE